MKNTIENLKNLGPKTAGWLREIGVVNREDVERLGSVEIYRLLKGRGYNVSLNLVWAIEAMLRDMNWRSLPTSIKAELKVAIKQL